MGQCLLIASPQDPHNWEWGSEDRMALAGVGVLARLHLAGHHPAMAWSPLTTPAPKGLLPSRSPHILLQIRGDSQVHCLFPACTTTAEQLPGASHPCSQQLGQTWRGYIRGGQGDGSSSVRTPALSSLWALVLTDPDVCGTLILIWKTVHVLGDPPLPRRIYCHF